MAVCKITISEDNLNHLSLEEKVDLSTEIGYVLSEFQEDNVHIEFVQTQSISVFDREIKPNGIFGDALGYAGNKLKARSAKKKYSRASAKAELAKAEMEKYKKEF